MSVVLTAFYSSYTCR